MVFDNIMSSSKDPSIFNKFFQRFSGGPKKSAPEKGLKSTKDDSDSVIPDINFEKIAPITQNSSESLYKNSILDSSGSFTEPVHSANSFPLRQNQNLSI